MLSNKAAENRVKTQRRVFQGWVRSFKQTKEQRDKAKFDHAVKMELQSISATYQKEIETLRQRLNEAERQ